MNAVSLETTRRALAHIPAHDRDLWVKMAFAVKSEHGEEGFTAWDEWSRSADSYRERSAREVWKSAKPGNITIGTLLHEAKQRGFALNGEGARIDPAEIERQHRERAEADTKAETERRAQAVKWAREIWKAAAPARQDHPYVQRKAVTPTETLREIEQERAAAILGYAPKQEDTFLTGRLLVLPVKVNDTLSTLELIDEQGRKTVLYGGTKAGGYWAAGALPEAGYAGALLIGEGAATMLSARAATGFHVAAALSASNLAPIAKRMREKYPSARLVILGDIGNGEDKARKAATEAGAALALPNFGADRKPEQTDFNDLARARGAEAVKTQIEAAQSVKQEAKSSPIIYRKISEIEAKPIRWLWPGRIARGKVSMIAGHPGLGKSQITASLAAIVTKGGRWPVDRTSCERGNVLFLSAEDDPADTIRPRLEAAGADLERINILQAVRDGFNAEGDEKQRAFNLKEDIRRLEAVLLEIGDVALVIIDPVSAYLGGADSHNMAEVRGLLAPLSDMAGRAGAAVVAVSHLNKGGGSGAGDALLRITGSLGFAAAARAAYIVAKDPEDEARRMFLPGKNNIGPDIGGLAFGIEACTIGAGIETSRIAWEAEAVTGMSADELLRAPADPEERSALDDARAWLRSMLADGPLPAKQIFREASEAGHAEKTVRRAQRAIGINPRKDGKTGPWHWALPVEDGQKAEDGQPQTHGHLQETWPPSGPELAEGEKF